LLNLMPDKAAALQEMRRVLKPGGRLQIGDILVQKRFRKAPNKKSTCGQVELLALCWKQS